MSTHIDAPRGADLLLSYIFPDGTDLTGCIGLFRVYDDRNGTVLLTVDMSAGPNGSQITINENVLTLDVKEPDITALPTNGDDPTSPAILYFDLFLTTTLGQVTKIHSGPLRGQPYGATGSITDGEIYANIGGQEIRVEVAPSTFDASVLSSVAGFASTAEQSATTASQASGTAVDAATSATASANSASYSASSVATILAAGGAVRFDAPQGLNTGQQGQARTNLDVYSTSQIDGTVSDLNTQIDALKNPLNISSFAATNPAVEVGSNVTPSLHWTLSINPVSQSINPGIGTVTPVTARSANAIASITSTTSYVLTVTDSVGGTKTATATVAFQNRFFSGAYATNDLSTKTAAAIRTALLSGSVLSNDATRTFSVDCGTGAAQFVYFAIPAGWTLSSFTAYGFDNLSSLIVNTVNITDVAGNSLSYKLYMLPNALNGVVPMVSHA